MSNTRAALRPDLAAIAARLGDEELTLLVLLARRALTGQARYGRLNVERDRRDFIRETLEEVADGLIYTGATLLAARRVRRHIDHRRLALLITGASPCTATRTRSPAPRPRRKGAR
jgi:hypothetical protein